MKDKLDLKNETPTFGNVLLCPVLGQTYNYFDDGKIKPSRRMEVVITEIIPFSEIDEETLKSDLEFLMSGNYPEILDENSTEENNSDSSTNSNQAPETPVVNEKDAQIIILNGSGKNGVATRASDLLKIEDFTITKTGNADKFSYDETIIYYKDNKKLANSVKKILGKGKIVQQAEKYQNIEPDVLIVIGKDF